METEWSAGRYSDGIVDGARFRVLDMHDPAVEQTIRLLCGDATLHDRCIAVPVMYLNCNIFRVLENFGRERDRHFTGDV